MNCNEIAITGNYKKPTLGIIKLLLFFPLFIYSQTPSLGLCSTFALFTSIGAINSTGTTNITGDIGTNVGAFNGFPPGIINGQTNIADGVSAQAALDVDAAYSFLTALTCDSVIGVTLGGSQTLTPNKYCIGAASTLNGDLILDGQGNPNALFIFKINGALSTGTLSNIVLINSAALTNVYWQINGLFSLGNRSVFKGTVIANGGVSLLDSASLQGHALSRGGAIALSNNSLSVSNNVVLPIELFSFTAECSSQKVFLKWSTASEKNNDFFTLEHSLDAIHWSDLGKVIGAGNSIVKTNYSFTDEEVYNVISYYRLKQTDFEGQYKYTPILFFNSCAEIGQDIFIYPNPGNGKIKLYYNGDYKAIRDVFIYNSFGETIYHSETYQLGIDLFDKPEGVYFVHFNLNGSVIVKKMLIEKL